MKNSKKKIIPEFKNQDEEMHFWSVADSAEYIDYTKSEIIDFPDLKPTSHSISLRIPDYLLNRLKVLAHKKDIPYQSLLKIYISQKVDEESREKVK